MRVDAKIYTAIINLNGFFYEKSVVVPMVKVTFGV